MSNINPETGIRFGTIYLHHLDHDTAAGLWDYAENISEQQAYDDLRAEITTEIDQEVEEYASRGEEPPFDAEREIERRLDRASENIEIEEPYLEGECEGVKYGISHLGGAALLWVYESPIIGKHGLCSPCVPNAGDLESEGDFECYDIPEDWKAKR